MTDSNPYAWLDKLPAVENPGLPAKVLAENPKYRELVAAMRDLTPAQKNFVQALPGANYVPRHALRALQDKGVKLSERTIYRWTTQPEVKRALDLMRSLAGEFAGIDALSVMLRVSAWADYCMEEVEVLDSEGKPTGAKRRRDPANGLKALELLGKHTGALKTDDTAPTVRQGPGLSITFIHGPETKVRVGEVIDVTPSLNMPKVKDNGNS